MMYAIKLFDSHGDAYTVPKFLEMAKLRADKFAQGSAKEVRELVADGDVEMAALKGTIKELRRRRNHILPTYRSNWCCEKSRKAKGF